MKRIVATIIMSAIVALSVVGCGGGGSGSSAAPEAPAAESVSEDANLVSAIGTAGSSLKAAQIAEEILTFTASREIANIEESARKDAFNEAWESLSSEEKGTVKDNFKDIAGLIDEAFSDYESARGSFEDAGVGAEMEELANSEDAQKSWKVLCDLLAEAE